MPGKCEITKVFLKDCIGWCVNFIRACCDLETWHPGYFKTYPSHYQWPPVFVWYLVQIVGNLNFSLFQWLFLVPAKGGTVGGI